MRLKMAELKKLFFLNHMRAINRLYDYGPNDSELLNIPYYKMAIDPLILAFNRPPISDPRKAMHLYSHLHSINIALSTTIAAYRFIMENTNTSINDDHEAIIHSDILRIYQISLREFITNLKVAVDQMLICLAEKNGHKYDCIGGFLKQIHQYKNFQYLECFFLKLNTAANYLKHHADQFESFQEIYSIGSNIRIIVSRKEDYKNICKYLKQSEIIQKLENEVSYILGVNELIDNFNKFKDIFLDELVDGVYCSPNYIVKETL